MENLTIVIEDIKIGETLEGQFNGIAYEITKTEEAGILIDVVHHDVMDNEVVNWFSCQVLEQQLESICESENLELFLAVEKLYPTAICLEIGNSYYFKIEEVKSFDTPEWMKN